MNWRKSSSRDKWPFVLASQESRRILSLDVFNKSNTCPCHKLSTTTFYWPALLFTCRDLSDTLHEFKCMNTLRKLSKVVPLQFHGKKCRSKLLLCSLLQGFSCHYFPYSEVCPCILHFVNDVDIQRWREIIVLRTTTLPTRLFYFQYIIIMIVVDLRVIYLILVSHRECRIVIFCEFVSTSGSYRRGKGEGGGYNTEFNKHSYNFIFFHFFSQIQIYKLCNN